MLCKAIIEEIINNYQARVRIPIYHKIASSSFATLKENLPIASICTIPGVDFALKVGEIVYVDFELDQIENPVIIGILSRPDSVSSSNITTESLKVNVNCSLPDNINYTETEERKQANVEGAIDSALESSGAGIARFG